MKPILRSLALVLLALSLGAATGCRGTHVSQRPIEVPGTVVAEHASIDTATAEQVHAAVLAGADAKGWSIVSDEGGVVRATVTSTGHTAVVDIPHDANGWRIEFVEVSEGLRHEVHPDHGPIVHHRYNNWVRLLNGAIRAKLHSEVHGD